MGDSAGMIALCGVLGALVGVVAMVGICFIQQQKEQLQAQSSSREVSQSVGRSVGRWFDHAKDSLSLSVLCRATSGGKSSERGMLMIVVVVIAISQTVFRNESGWERDWIVVERGGRW